MDMFNLNLSTINSLYFNQLLVSNIFIQQQIMGNLQLIAIAVLAVAYYFKDQKDKQDIKILLQKTIYSREKQYEELKALLNKSTDNQFSEFKQLNELIHKVFSSGEHFKSVQSEPNQVYLKQHSHNPELRSVAKNSIYKIVITGGPCAGKSTSLKKIDEQFTAKGFRVFSVPQIPTLVVHAGGMILMAKFNMQERIHFQTLLIKFQMYAEDYFTRLAEMSKTQSIVLCDRGTVDPAAYVSKEEFQAIMDEEGWTWTTLRDRRYDHVIHMTTAALGAEKFYTLQNNVARSEGVDLARLLDQKTLNAWTGHPHITVCPNIQGQTFEKKIERAIRAVYQTVGIELKNNRQEKYLIDVPDFPKDLKVQTAQIQQVFLLNEDKRWAEDKIKRRSQNNCSTYQRKYRSVKNQEGQYPQQIRVPLTSLQYVTLQAQKADPNYSVTRRERIYFIINNISYSIDVYQNLFGEKKTYLLRFPNIQKVDGDSLIPNFIKVIKNVRQNPEYELKNIARVK